MMRSDDDRLHRLFALLRCQEESSVPPFSRVISAARTRGSRARRVRRLAMAVATLTTAASILGVAIFTKREPAPPAPSIQTVRLTLPLDCLLEPPSAIVAETGLALEKREELTWGLGPSALSHGGDQW